MKKFPAIAILLVIIAAAWFFAFRGENAETPLNASGTETAADTSTCNNSITDGNETGVDCGGPCQPCPSCNDLLQNQDETGVDCGGPCFPCETVTTTLAAVENETVTCDFMRPGYKSVTILGHILDPKLIRDPLLGSTADYIYLDPTKRDLSNVTFECHWGYRTGERVDLYYCTGNYTTPRLTKQNVIIGPIAKTFSVGMEVSKRTELDNKSKEYKVTTLLFSSINASCIFF